MPGNSAQIQERITILRAQEGDRDAFSTLIESYDRRLLYFIRRILGDVDGAFDVLQSVWLTVHRKLRGLETTNAFRVWLYRIAHDQAVSELRRKLKRPVLFGNVDTLPIIDQSDSENDAFDDAELVHQALQSLSIDHRRVIALRFLEEMTVDEIAQVIQCGVGTVKSRLHYAKAALRLRIEELIHG